MSPFADFTYFGFMLYAVVPTVVLGLFGLANWRWALLATVGVLAVQFSDALAVHPGWNVREVLIVGGFALWQGAVALAFLRWKSRATFYAALALALFPLAASKFLPHFSPDSAFGFLGISYVTFRALDVVFSIHDRVITTLAPAQYFAFLFFFPTVSSGPIDRYRRFGQDWNRLRGRGEFLDDLNVAIDRVFQGFLYKFIVAALLKVHWVDIAAKQPGALGSWNYMYAYTLYLFFDFAGYSAFAIGFSRLFGIRTPENFDRPFLSRNIRDFWNRWHISLSFWFRDHVYMRFLLAAGKGKWFKGKHTASYLGLFLTFGLMGVWHGTELHYLLYGLYHAVLLCSYDAFARWNKQAKWWPDGRGWRALNILITCHAVAFGLLLFSGHITPRPPPPHEEVLEKADCEALVGFVWDRRKPNEPLTVDIFIDRAPSGRVVAGEFREDLHRQGYGDGRHGFRWPIPDWMRDGRPHTVEIKVVESGRTLRGTPEVITCQRP
jgi:membrane protein involved in D-alanine export